jgi:hypothetical protein
MQHAASHGAKSLAATPWRGERFANATQVGDAGIRQLLRRAPRLELTGDVGFVSPRDLRVTACGCVRELVLHARSKQLGFAPSLHIAGHADGIVIVLAREAVNLASSKVGHLSTEALGRRRNGGRSTERWAQKSRVAIGSPQAAADAP